jgi:hypothetical protein
MLYGSEHKIMNYLFLKCRGKKTVLMTPQEILQSLLPKYELTAKQLEIAMKNLSLDGYIDVFHSDNKGSLNYVVTLKPRGEAFQREIDEARRKLMRSVGWKLLLTVMGVAVTWILMRIISS